MTKVIVNIETADEDEVEFVDLNIEVGEIMGRPISESIPQVGGKVVWPPKKIVDVLKQIDPDDLRDVTTSLKSQSTYRAVRDDGLSDMDELAIPVSVRSWIRMRDALDAFAELVDRANVGDEFTDTADDLARSIDDELLRHGWTE